MTRRASAARPCNRAPDSATLHRGRREAGHRIEEMDMRALMTHQPARPLASVPQPADDLVATIDAALAFGSSRELFTNAEVVGMFSMVDAALAPLAGADALRAALARAELALTGREVVSTGELVDRLLDARIAATGTTTVHPPEMAGQPA